MLERIGLNEYSSRLNAIVASAVKLSSIAVDSFCWTFEGPLARRSSRSGVRARTLASVGNWPISAFGRGPAGTWVAYVRR